ncbi:MAG: SDR family oxidoreductase [Rhizobiaceae bacterium]
MSPKLFIFGAGYSGRALALHMLQRQWDVAGTTRSPQKAAALSAEGVRALVFEGPPTPEIREALASTTHLLVSIAPSHGMGSKQSGSASLDPTLEAFGAYIREKMPCLEWIGYWSTVGVYGDHGGDWVDETAACRPASRRAQMRVDAEAEWQELGRDTNIPVAIMRLGGIYGPGRNAFIKLAEGTAKRIVKPGQVFSRIHVEDIAGSTALLAEKRIGGIFNIADNEPGPPQDVIAFAAELMGIEPPQEIPFEEADMSPMARSFYSDNKRISNGSIKEMGYDFAYPDYRIALRRMWDEESWR